jgi:hypothetical protein
MHLVRYYATYLLLRFLLRYYASYYVTTLRTTSLRYLVRYYAT